MMMATAENVAQLPEPDLPPAICSYTKEYILYFFHRNGWRRAADELCDCELLTPKMQSFCRQIYRMKQRPSTKQLATLLSLHVNVGAQELFAELADEERKAPKPTRTASVIKLKSKG
jgi:hypothetical protein